MMIHYRLLRAFTMMVLLLVVSFTALAGQGGPQADYMKDDVIRLPDGSVDCAAYQDYTGFEPIAVANTCGALASPSGRASVLDAWEMGYAQDVGYISDNYIHFPLSNFSGQSVITSSLGIYFGMDFDPAAQTLYALNDTTEQLGTIDLVTGEFTGLVNCPPPNGTNWTGLAIDPVSGAFYGSTDSTLYSINPATGETTEIGNFGTLVMIAIAINADGVMYGHDIGTDSIYRIDRTTGAATLVGLTGYLANYAQGMDFDNNDGTLYIFLYQGGGSNIYGTVNLDTGAVTPLAVNAPTGEFEGATRTTIYKQMLIPLVQR